VQRSTVASAGPTGLPALFVAFPLALLATATFGTGSHAAGADSLPGRQCAGVGAEHRVGHGGAATTRRYAARICGRLIGSRSESPMDLPWVPQSRFRIVSSGT
jgi:hypothetical protein